MFRAPFRLSLGSALLLLGLAGAGVSSGAGVSPSATGAVIQIGVASYYGVPFHGRQTANGEIFDMSRLTAAHRSLPFGTQLRVTNLRNGLSVVVRVNDRGPFIKGRVIDLSYAAAAQLGFLDKGLVRVQITPLANPPEASLAAF